MYVPDHLYRFLIESTLKAIRHNSIATWQKIVVLKYEIHPNGKYNN